jgi:hypothetical protein
MVVTIDTKSIKKLGMTPNEYVYLAFLVNNLECNLSLGIGYARMVELKMITLDKKRRPSPTQKAFDLFQIPVQGVTVPSDPRMDVPGWIEEYRNLFPQGVRSGGYPVRGSKAGCLKKMEKFVKSHPHYSKDTILAVTRSYVERKQRQAYQHMKLADYFIEKDGVSMLSAECEEYLADIQDVGKDGQQSWGRDV